MGGFCVGRSVGFLCCYLNGRTIIGGVVGVLLSYYET